MVVCKEIVERRHGEPIKFLFLPKMGLFGRQASNEKKGCLIIGKHYLGVKTVFLGLAVLVIK
jgi:hypothetical protein